LGLIEKLWNPDAERGVVWGLIYAFVALGIFGTLLPFTGQKYVGSDVTIGQMYQHGIVAYGVLWTWLNPYFWTQQPYMFLNMLIVGLVFIFQYFLVRRGFLNKNLVLLAFFLCVVTMAIHLYQDTTILMLSPFISITPAAIIPMLLEKLPLGWSWNLSDPNWACGIYGRCAGVTINRFSLMNEVNFSYVLLAISVIIPLIVWLRTPTGWVESFTPIWFEDDVAWPCVLCGEWMATNITDDGRTNGFWVPTDSPDTDFFVCWCCVLTNDELLYLMDEKLQD
jgi:hypothetical protein